MGFPELEGHDCEYDKLPGNSKLVWDLLLQLDLRKSLGPGGIHLRTLKEMTDVMGKPL